jgi:hypothetical protein
MWVYVCMYTDTHTHGGRAPFYARLEQQKRLRNSPVAELSRVTKIPQKERMTPQLLLQLGILNRGQQRCVLIHTQKILLERISKVAYVVSEYGCEVVTHACVPYRLGSVAVTHEHGAERLWGVVVEEAYERGW